MPLIPFGEYPPAVADNQAQFAAFLNNALPRGDGYGPFPDFSASTAPVAGRFIVLSGLLSNPYRVQWSGLNDVTQWTPGVNSSDFQDLPDGGIVRGVAGGEYGNIFQDGAIRRMTFAPGSPFVFQIERIAEDRGLYAPYSLIRSGDRIFFLSADGFMT